MLACDILSVLASMLTCQVVIAVVLENFIIQWTARRTRHTEKMNFLGENPLALPNAKMSFSPDKYSPHPTKSDDIAAKSKRCLILRTKRRATRARPERGGGGPPDHQQA